MADDETRAGDGAVDRAGGAEAEPPVVARLVIEIRSDGTRTLARGALEDAALGERVAVEARGGSPAELAGQLLRALLAAPVQAALARWTGPSGHVPEDSEGGLGQRLRRRALGAVRRRLRLP
jgi:hypothetical protein